MKWTSEQRQIIDARGSNLIVSAAAGSGKTAVLVERICSLVLGEGADMERMLVSTFTRAAAAEMKGRIVERLTLAASERGPAAGRLNEQLLKIDRAPIGTLHSFCGEILRQYYNVAGIEPSFKTEDESVTRGLYDDALEEVVDEFFEAGDEDFLALADCWGGRDGSGLAELASTVYDSARNYPDYLQWLKDRAEQFSFTDVAETPWFGELMEELASSLALALESIGEALKDANQPQGPLPYLPRLKEENAALELLHTLAAERDLNGLKAALGGAALFGRLPAWKDINGTGIGERVKAFRKEAKKFYEQAQENPLVAGLEEAAERTRAMYPQMKALTALVTAFDERYSEEKRYANVLDFSDLEHMALAVLADPDAREEIQHSFDYVFVDEYQDISPIQDELLRRVSRPGAFFCVGDVKQSIYRFRSAEPEIFIRRLACSQTGQDAPERRIDLSSNFRSAGRVITLANYLFSHVMSTPLGGVEYAGPERLVQAADQPDVQMKGICNELLLIDNGGRHEEELSRLEELIQIEREATVVAAKIKELIGTLVWDGKAGKYKKLRYQDITILLRTVSRVAGDYAEVLRRAGIPVYADAEGGFADEVEVQLLMNLLGLLDNSRRDYELITSMHSRLGGFSLEDLIEVRGFRRDGSFAEAVFRYAGDEDSELAGRVKAFLERLSRWRALALHSDIEKLIYAICDDTGFCDWAGTLPDGERRQANIARLAGLSRGFTNGLYDFIRNFGKIAASSRGKSSGPAAGAVAVMSVHKSKGLEFPVVILSNVGKLINLKSAGESMLLHGELGLGPRYFNAARRTKADTLASAALSARIRRDTLSEEVRMLYVAVTRARERLIIVGTVPNLAKKLASWSMPLTSSGLASRAHCWADWLGPVAMRSRPGAEAFTQYGADAGILPDSPDDWQITVLDASGIKSLKPEPADREKALEVLMQAVEDAEVPEDTAAALSWRYPWGDVAALPSKVSATSLLDKSRNWRGPIPAPEIRRRPRFTEEKKSFSATDLGTFAHAALQLLPIDIAPADIPGEVEGLEARGLLPEGAAASINTLWIERFYRSSIAGRIRSSPRVQRELPFNLAVPAHVVFPGETGGDGILVQGIIDCCFIEDGKWVLVDYKTNRVDTVNTVEIIAGHYKPQLQVYRSALEEITGIDVKEACLYLLSVGVEVKVNI